MDAEKRRCTQGDRAYFSVTGVCDSQESRKAQEAVGVNRSGKAVWIMVKSLNFIFYATENRYSVSRI